MAIFNSYFDITRGYSWEHHRFLPMAHGIFPSNFPMESTIFARSSLSKDPNAVEVGGSPVEMPGRPMTGWIGGRKNHGKNIGDVLRTRTYPPNKFKF